MSVNLDEVKARHQKADKTVVDLCQGDMKWRMSIPARPDSDPDIVIQDSLCDIPKMAAEIERLRERLKEIHIAVQEVEEKLTPEYLKENDEEYIRCYIMPSGVWHLLLGTVRQ